ncbi:MAG: hypothetical protein L0I24_12355 [Pseudonocardia sp.]|nr:hypothetical protein [Pseudonocardia sp.]
MTDQKVGAQLDALGVTLDLDEHQHISDAVVLARLGDATDGCTALVIGASAGCDWIAQLGLLVGARIVVAASVGES